MKHTVIAAAIAAAAASLTGCAFFQKEPQPIRIQYEAKNADATGLIRAFDMRGDTVLQFFTVCLLIYVVLSWVAPDVRNPAVQLLSRICEPVLRPVRRVVPPLGGLDLSALIVLVALQVLRILLH